MCAQVGVSQDSLEGFAQSLQDALQDMKNGTG